jgi:molybdenum-dependent DNA-binding transcriptional regulator ModE
VIESRQGGSAGGFSAVTEAGLELMRNYAAFCAEVNQCLNVLYKQYFAQNGASGYAELPDGQTAGGDFANDEYKGFTYSMDK